MKQEGPIDPKRQVGAAALNALNVFRQWSDYILEEAHNNLWVNYDSFQIEHAALERDLQDAVDLLQAHFQAFDR